MPTRMMTVLKDGEEINTHDTDPMKADSDKDGLNDNIEIAKMTDPNNPDSDGDNLKDGEEVNMHKTNPTRVTVTVMGLTMPRR